jgi:peptidoglycan/LPS O-acetylase OafA/YrhL
MLKASAMELATGKKLKYIDALRGIAIVGVLLVHCGQAGTNHYPPFLQNIILNGSRGVQLFYMASAFTIFLTYAGRREMEVYHKTNFFIRRFFRIAPLYYVGIVYYLYQNGLGARYFLGDVAEVSTWNIVSNVLFVNGFNPYWITSVVPGGWSVAVEMFFYCMVPFLFLRIRNLNQSVLFFIFSIFLRMGLQVVLHRFPLIAFDRLWNEYLFFYLPNQLPVFACGIIFYFLVNTPRSEWRVEPLVAFALSILFLTQLATHTNFIFPVHVQFGIAFIVLGYALSRKEFYALVNPVTIYFGKISYSMYLVHFAILYGLTRLHCVDFIPTDTVYLAMINFVLRFCLLISLTALGSTITYHLIEVPFQNIGKKIIKRREDGLSHDIQSCLKADRRNYFLFQRSAHRALESKHYDMP